MADYSKREQNRADIHRIAEEGIAPPKFPMPRCHCGELATIGAYTKRGAFHFCEAHRAEADAIFEQGA